MTDKEKTKMSESTTKNMTLKANLFAKLGEEVLMIKPKYNEKSNPRTISFKDATIVFGKVNLVLGSMDSSGDTSNFEYGVDGSYANKAFVIKAEASEIYGLSKKIKGSLPDIVYNTDDRDLYDVAAEYLKPFLKYHHEITLPYKLNECVNNFVISSGFFRFEKNKSPYIAYEGFVLDENGESIGKKTRDLPAVKGHVKKYKIMAIKEEE
jgi:hypothetical protein